MTNALIVLSSVFFGSFGLAIIVFTFIMRGITFPMTMRQLKSTRALSAIQPRIQEIQKKYKDPKRRSEETMKLYREAKINPLGCLTQMAIQMPIWFALYQVIRIVLGPGAVPEALVGLDSRLYSWPIVQQAIPVSDTFLGIKLGAPSLILALFTGATMFVQQKMSMSPTIDERQKSTNSMMLWMMPLMFTYIATTVPAGLPLYWTASALVGIVLQYVIMGAGGLTLRNLFSLQPPAPPQTPPVKKHEATEEPEEESSESDEEAPRAKKRSRHGKRRSKR